MAKYINWYLDYYEWLIPYAGLLIKDWLIFVVDFHKARPVRSTVLEVVLGHEERNTSNYRSLVKDSVKILIIFIVLRENLGVFVDVIRQQTFPYAEAVSFIIICVVPNSVSLQIWDVYFIVLWPYLLIRSEKFGICSNNFIIDFPRGNQFPFCLVSVESCFIDSHVIEAIDFFKHTNSFVVCFSCLYFKINECLLFGDIWVIK